MHGIGMERLTCRHTRSGIHMSSNVERFIVQAELAVLVSMIMLLMLEPDPDILG